MTDNEKRAHDLAIASIPIAFENHQSAILNELIPEDTPFDIYSTYMECYKNALESFNRDF